MVSYPAEQLQELYKTLPEKLQNALYSKENAKNLNEICRKNGIDDEGVVLDIARLSGYVLFGLLPPNKLSSFIQNDLKIEKEVSEKIANGITKHIFMPIKDVLEPLYDTEIKLSPEKKPTKPAVKQKKKIISGPKADHYREPIT